MSITTQRNVAALITPKKLSLISSAVAAGSGDATTVTGVTIDRFAFAGGGQPDSALLAIVYDATLASGKTLSFAYAVQHADVDNTSSFSDYQTAGSTVASTGPSGGGVVSSEVPIAVNLTSAKRFVRLNFQPDLSATGTDTALAIGVGVFAGFDRLPAAAS